MKKWFGIFCLLLLLLASCESEEEKSPFGKEGNGPGFNGESSGGEVATQEKDYDGTIPVIFSIHMESSTSRVCDDTGARCADDDEWQHMMDATQSMVENLDATGLKGTFQFQSHWMTRLQESEQGLAIIDAMIAGGHEIALHRHGFTHNDWDGYSDDPDAANGHDEYTGLEPKSMDEYMEIVHAFEEKYGVQITTVEGTDLQVDAQEEWIFRTGDDGNNKYAQELVDPNGACPVGRPTWSTVNLPNTARSVASLGYHSIPHTHFGPKTPECAEVMSAHIFTRIDEILEEGYGSTDALNFVFHPSDYSPYGTEGGTAEVYNAFFATLGSMDELDGMTVQTFMCERVGECLE